MKKHNLQQVELKFPANMMSTSRSEFAMPTNFAKFVKNMIIHYSGAGSKRNGFTKSNYELPADEVVIHLMDFPNDDGKLQILAVTKSGNIYRQIGDSDFKLVYSGLAKNAQISTAMFANKIILADGVNPILKYDGKTFKTIQQYISQDKFQFQIASNNSIKTDCFAENFPIGRKVKIKLADGSEHETVVTSTSNSLDKGFIIIHLQDEIVTQTVTNIYYQLTAPILARVYAAHDRLWATGHEPFKLGSFSTNIDKSRIYYTDIANNEDSWYDDEGNLSSINFADKMPDSDELVAMAVKDTMTIFFFRNYCQVWSGTNPRASGNMAWLKTIPVGLIHPNLVVNMPNDIGFFSQFGARTLSRMLQTEQLDVADMGSEVATEIHNAMEKVRIDFEKSKNIQSFQFHRQNWFGFKLDTDVMILQANGQVLSWSKFDGIFSDASAFLNTPDGKLYAVVGNKFYYYNTESFADDSKPIHTVWSTGWFMPNNAKMWANKYSEIILEPSALKTANLQRFKNYNSASYIQKNISLKSLPDYYDSAYWDNGYFDSYEKEKAIVRDKFIANQMMLSLQTEDTNGPFTIHSLRFYGSKEK